MTVNVFDEPNTGVLGIAAFVSTVEFEATGVRDVHPMADGKSYQRLRRLAKGRYCALIAFVTENVPRSVQSHASTRSRRPIVRVSLLEPQFA